MSFNEDEIYVMSCDSIIPRFGDLIESSNERDK